MHLYYYTNLSFSRIKPFSICGSFFLFPTPKFAISTTHLACVATQGLWGSLLPGPWDLLSLVKFSGKWREMGRESQKQELEEFCVFAHLSQFSPVKNKPQQPVAVHIFSQPGASRFLFSWQLNRKPTTINKKATLSIYYNAKTIFNNPVPYGAVLWHTCNLGRYLCGSTFYLSTPQHFGTRVETWGKHLMNNEDKKATKQARELHILVLPKLTVLTLCCSTNNKFPV